MSYQVEDKPKSGRGSAPSVDTRDHTLALPMRICRVCDIEKPIDFFEYGGDKRRMCADCYRIQRRDLQRARRAQQHKSVPPSPDPSPCSPIPPADDRPLLMAQLRLCAQALCAISQDRLHGPDWARMVAEQAIAGCCEIERAR